MEKRYYTPQKDRDGSRGARKMTSGKGTRKGMVIFTVLSVGLLLVGAYLANRNLTFQNQAGQAEGVVTALDYRRSSSSSGGTYYPEVRWRAPDGNDYRFTGDFGTSPSAYDVGERVKVFYDPQDYHDVRLGGFFGTWGLPAILFLFGGIFGLFVWLTIRKGGHHSKDEQWLRLHGRDVQADVVDDINELPPHLQKIIRFLMPDPDLLQEKVTTGALMLRWTDPATGKTHYYNPKDIPTEIETKAHADGYLHLRIDPDKPQRFIVA